MSSSPGDSPYLNTLAEAAAAMAREFEESLTQQYRDWIPSLPEVSAVPDLSFPISNDYSMADTFFESLQQAIEEEEAALGPDEHLLVSVATATGILLVQELDYQNPNILIISGVNTVQITMQRVNLEAEEPRRPIGFRR